MVLQRLVGNIPFRWIFYWLVLPNLAVIAMWPIGGPPMSQPLMLSGLLGLALSQLPWRPVKIAGVAALTLTILAFYICRVFSIPLLDFALFRQFLSDVRPMQSPEYLVAGVLMTGVVALAVWRAPRVPRFSTPLSYMIAVLAIMGLMITDSKVTANSANHFAVDPRSIQKDSAVAQVGLSPEKDRPHHVLVILVEALGQPAAPEEQAMLDADWDRPEWRARYDVQRGVSRYWGPTIYGEMRELCGYWDHYSTVDFAKADCLPEKFLNAGYETTAIHSFFGNMFERNKWYPKLHFQNTEFAETLKPQHVRTCGGVFPGACDSDVAPIIGRRLAEAKKPQFVYWLTLNSHLPITADVAQNTAACRIGPAQWRDDFPALCRLYQLHHELANAVSSMIMAPGMPPTDILIVGDHRPPFFDRASRKRFQPNRVPWIYLRARDGGAPDMQKPAPSGTGSAKATIAAR